MIGHHWARNLLGRAAERGRLCHSYMFVGPESVGKTSLAMHLAGYLVCTSSGSRPCGTCRGCRILDHGTHPDVSTISRAVEHRDITIDQIRQLEQGVALAPYEAPHKLFCIADADTMNDAAASALLKTLEEPPTQATLVLAVKDPFSLPSTIRSRCQALVLQPVPAAEIAAGLSEAHHVPDDLAREIASLARGRPGWAVRALGDPELVEHERAIVAIINGLPAQGPYSRMTAIDAWLGKRSFLEARERALDLLARLELWWRDALFSIHGVSSQSAASGASARHVIGIATAQGLSMPDIVAFLLATQVAASRIAGNVAPRLALEHLIATMPSPTSRLTRV